MNSPEFRVPVLSPKSISPLVTSMVPNLSLLFQYPMFFLMARVTVHRSLSLRANGRQMSAIHASLNHGIDLYNKFGLFALYRGLPVYVSHSCVTVLLSHPLKRFKPAAGSEPNAKPSAKTARKQIIVSCLGKIVVDAAAYPLLLACTRMAAYTTGDSSWSFTQCVKDSVSADGLIGLWAGAAPFLLVSAYKELEDWIFRIIKSSVLPTKHMDEADETLVSFFRLGFGAVLTSPFLTMSTILRCQSNDTRLLKPTGFLTVFREMPWKWNMIAIGAVLGLGAVNVMLIKEKHIEDAKNEERNQQ